MRNTVLVMSQLSISNHMPPPEWQSLVATTDEHIKPNEPYSDQKAAAWHAWQQVTELASNPAASNTNRRYALSNVIAASINNMLSEGGVPAFVDQAVETVITQHRAMYGHLPSLRIDDIPTYLHTAGLYVPPAKRESVFSLGARMVANTLTFLTPPEVQKLDLLYEPEESFEAYAEMILDPAYEAAFSQVRSDTFGANSRVFRKFLYLYAQSNSDTEEQLTLDTVIDPEGLRQLSIRKAANALVRGVHLDDFSDALQDLRFSDPHHAYLDPAFYRDWHDTTSTAECPARHIKISQHEVATAMATRLLPGIIATAEERIKVGEY